MEAQREEERAEIQQQLNQQNQQLHPQFQPMHQQQFTQSDPHFNYAMQPTVYNYAYPTNETMQQQYVYTDAPYVHPYAPFEQQQQQQAIVFQPQFISEQPSFDTQPQYVVTDPSYLPIQQPMSQGYVQYASYPVENVTYAVENVTYPSENVSYPIQNVTYQMDNSNFENPTFGNPTFNNANFENPTFNSANFDNNYSFEQQQQQQQSFSSQPRQAMRESLFVDPFQAPRVISMAVASRVTSNYLRHERQNTFKASTLAWATAVESKSVLVMEAGSQWLKWGRASEGMPHIIPHCIARRDTSKENSQFTHAGEEQRALIKEQMQNLIEMRMQLYNRKYSPPDRDQLIEYNSASVPMPAVDPEPEHKEAYLVGQQAVASSPHYKVRYPLSRGHLNQEDYSSLSACLSDLSLIWQKTVFKDIQNEQVALILIVPDQLDKITLEAMIEMIFREFPISHFYCLNSSMAVTFGAGISTACVVQLGAKVTAVACVEDGYLLPLSRIALPFGCDDLITTLYHDLTSIQFPIPLKNAQDMYCLSQLFMKMSSVQPADLAARVLSLDWRGKRYSFKYYEEGVLAVLSYFFPGYIVSPKPGKKLISLNAVQEEVEETAPLPVWRTSGRKHYYAQMHCVDAVLNATTADEEEADQVAPMEQEQQQQQPVQEISYKCTFGTCQEEFTVIGLFLDHLKQHDTGSSQCQSRDADKEMCSPLKLSRAGWLSHMRQHGTVMHDIAQVNEIKEPEEPNENEELPHTCMALDDAILQSIGAAVSQPDWTTLSPKSRPFLANILPVGGGALIPGMSELLAARLYDRLSFLGHTVAFTKQTGHPDTLILQVLSAPRDMDPRQLGWKGGVVWSHLESSRDGWIGRMEFDRLGMRSVREKVLFSW